MYAGGGLMAVGLKAAGYDLIWANDFDKRAVEAYAHNIGDHIVHGDITQIDPDDIPDADVIAGGPPCQDYSVAGTGAGEEGERGKLVWDYLAKIERKQPKAFVFENVKGLISRRHRHTFDALLRRFEEIGYIVSWRLINAWDYGVAQKRERVFIVGIRKDIGFTFEFPEPRPEDYRTQVLRDVIGDLPEPTENHDPKPLSDGAIAYLERDPRRLQRHRPPTLEEASNTLPANLHKGVPYGLVYPNHEHTASRIDSPAKTIVSSTNGVPGGANCFYPENHDNKSFWMPKSEYTFDQANRVQSMDSACNTIPAHHNSGQPIHPTQRPRRFTVRECLRIQSVPDWYVLPSTISLSAQYRIVGNGVASRVAYLIGISLAEQLRAATERSGIIEQEAADWDGQITEGVA